MSDWQIEQKRKMNDGSLGCAKTAAGQVKSAPIAQPINAAGQFT